MSDDVATTVTSLLADAGRGDASALAQLFPIVYDELREVARIQRRRRRGAETLNTTALVHEAFIRLVRTQGIELQDRAHFIAVAATAMRHVLISYARGQSAAKRGGRRTPIAFDQVERALEAGLMTTDVTADALLALDDALTRLGERSERQMRVVDCRFFSGLSIEETATALGVSPATVKRDWSLAQAWLYRELQEAR